ncbi:response regulator transcription factor [Hoeflea sp. TYP-13]|uniref:response regulator transcription factor n=1 Tax=Hoeflea sp. TYP-13 TaxID=3230023 RepID=UPI0034C6A807
MVEDHPELHEMISGHLNQRGFTVDAVAFGDEALSAIRTANYALVILDLGLPDMDGLSILAELRTGITQHLPVLILTARDSVSDRVHGLDAGADDYIVKPFDLSELEARLRAVMRRPGVRDNTTYDYAELTFDTISRQASVAGVPLDLSRRETALLEELISAAGRVVVKDVLEERLYGFNEAVTPNAVEAAVSRLRRKFQGTDTNIRIETRRGIGYRLTKGAEA